jgi:hypothetical protein
MINITCTSKPVDGLLYYSYEYCSYLNSLGIKSTLIIICHRNFSQEEYIASLTSKYICFENVIFDNYSPNYDDVTLIMGRSMLTLAFLDFRSYNNEQQTSLKKLFSEDLISVYSENHPTKYPLAINFFSPKRIIDLCDTDVYPCGIGDHFEKRINFSIYKVWPDNIKFKYLFLGTNSAYYKSVEKIINNYDDYGILTYNDNYINSNYNNVFVPVVNLMSIFDTYVYTKDTFDPAPRLIQECKFYGKSIIYARDSLLTDGGSVYTHRNVQPPDVSPILQAIEKLKC